MLQKGKSKYEEIDGFFELASNTFLYNFSVFLLKNIWFWRANMKKLISMVIVISLMCSATMAFCKWNRDRRRDCEL